MNSMIDFMSNCSIVSLVVFYKYNWTVFTTFECLLDTVQCTCH